jgi:outer membrane immunogenic protein
MRKSFSVLLIVTSALSTNAFAADLYTPVPGVTDAPLRPAFSWQGAYVGGQAGYHWGKGSFQMNGISTSASPEGLNAGVYAGHNFEIMPSFILGLDADIGYDGIRYNDNNVGTTITAGLESSIRARMGYAFDRTLVYAAGGYTGMNAKFENGNSTAKQWLNGWTVGAGVDYALADNVFIRGEYRYSRYSPESFEFLGSNARVGFSKQTVKIGFGVKY